MNLSQSKIFPTLTIREGTKPDGSECGYERLLGKVRELTLKRAPSTAFCSLEH